MAKSEPLILTCNRSVTGRDAHLIRKAVATALAVIDSLPEHCRALSDRDDLDQLLTALSGGDDDWRRRAVNGRYPLNEEEWGKPLPDLQRLMDENEARDAGKEQ